MKSLQRALISCTDKTGLVELGAFLSDQNIEILSTGGTARLLRENNIAVTDVADYTGSPEILDGRLKTLHPKVHGGILNIRDNATHQKELAENNIGPIDLIIVNLYAFEKTIAKENVTRAEAIENIDIGGPTMLRAAAKNYKDVIVITDPGDYPELQRRIAEQDLTEEYRFQRACQVFQKTAHYDAAISKYLNASLASPTQDENAYPEQVSLSLTKVQDLRYGENPHQRAAFYREGQAQGGLVSAQKLQGKELSFNNILDLEAAYQTCREFSQTTCVIVKHLNPCGVACADSVTTAFQRAKQSDPVSCFGGIVAFNHEVDAKTAQPMNEVFFEAIIAPRFTPEARELFASKKNLRLLELPDFFASDANVDVRRVSGGFLLQDQDQGRVSFKDLETVTTKKPTPEQTQDLEFAWTVVKHVKSNAIVIAKDKQILGVGAGQMSRVDSVKLACQKALDYFGAEALKGSVLAGDAFFPFRDGADIALKNGVAAVAQPGGSIRDKEVIAACEEHQAAMVFTKMRHFWH